MAVLLSWSLFLLWACTGLALLSLARYRWQLTTLLFAPTVGFVAIVALTYFFVRWGYPVRVSAWPIVVVTLLGTVAILARYRPSGPRWRGLWRHSRVWAVLLLATFGVTAWPMFGYGLNWLANGNDDMANYCLMATGYREHGYVVAPDGQDLGCGTDYTQAFFGFPLSEARPGSEVLLALVSAWTGGPVVQLFMPVIVALNLALVAAAGGLAIAGTGRRSVGVMTAGLLMVSSQTTYGVVQQLIAQVSGLAILCVALALINARWSRVPGSLLVARASVTGVVLAGQTLFYPEVIPLLVGACVVLGVRRIIVQQLDRRYLLHAALAVGVMFAMFPVYVSATARFILAQGSQGTNAAYRVQEMFPFNLTPRLGALVWGLLPFTGPESEEFQNVAIAVGLALLVVVGVPVVVGLRRGSPFAALLAVGSALGVLLFTTKSAFGLFKLVMFLQPFLWAAVAAWVLSRRTRWAFFAATAGLLILAIQNARVQFWYVDQSRGREFRVELPSHWGRQTLRELQAEVQQRQQRGEVDQILIGADNLYLTKLLVPELRGIPTLCLGVNQFDMMVRNLLPGMEEMPRAWHYREQSAGAFQRLRDTYLAHHPHSRGPHIRDPEQGVLLHRLMTSQPDVGRLHPERTLVVIPSGSLSVLNRFHYPEKSQPLICTPLGGLRNVLVFCDATGARQAFLGMDDAREIALHRLEADPSFAKRTFAGVGQALVVHVLNPTPQVRVLVNTTGSCRVDPVRRQVPPVQVIGDRRVALGAVGIGSARLVSPPLTPQALAGGHYLAFDFGEPTRNPNKLPAAEKLWARDLPRDRRWLSGHVRDISVISEDEYAAFVPPAGVHQFPHDLQHPHLEYSGFVEDGWIGATAKIRLSQTDSHQECVIRGLIPGLPGAENFQTEAVVRVDGVVVERRTLHPGKFELRAAGPLGIGPRWVELQFSHLQILPEPDGRQVAALIHSIGFEARDEARARPPERLQVFPADLSHPKLEQVGIYGDGWCREHLRAKLLPPAEDSEVVMRGFIPEVGGNSAFFTELTIWVDGVEVARRSLGLGEFEVRAPVARGPQARWIECRFSHTQTLAPPDGRTIAAQLRFLGLEPLSTAP
ncbi:MAG: hypothetical protein RMJ56_08660 [Gemmataceae bacterium]|nr:hypothetical protein [Gemmata sp.]MDW8197657.1 hypothetical protein [Gemmataceae bacterium]